MRIADVDRLQCPIARAVSVVGDGWCLMIVRELYLGSRRFDQFEAQLRMPTAGLVGRLRVLEAQGIVRKRAYQSAPRRYEYHLTKKGIDLWPLMIALKHWGDRWGGWKSKKPAALRHKTCGGETGLTLTCDCCKEPLTAFDVELEQRAAMASERRQLHEQHLERNRQKQRRRRTSST